MKMQVHISIDDVGSSFRHIIRAHPGSIFDLRFYKGLKDWHDRYDAKFTCYCIVEFDGYSFFDIPLKYAEDFQNCASWLRFGFHGCDSLKFSQSIDYADTYDKFMWYLHELKMGDTDFLRLHSWMATEKQKRFLVSRGVRTLHYPDDDIFSYNSEDEFVENGLRHKRTRVWLEKLGEITDQTLCIGRNYVGVFTHEWCFDEQKDKMELAICRYQQNGYQFI